MPPDPRFDVPCGRLDRNQARVQDGLAVQDAVQRRQHRVDGPLMREDLHGHRLLEDVAHLLVGVGVPNVSTPPFSLPHLNPSRPSSMTIDSM